MKLSDYIDKGEVDEHGRPISTPAAVRLVLDANGNIAIKPCDRDINFTLGFASVEPPQTKPVVWY